MCSSTTHSQLHHIRLHKPLSEIRSPGRQWRYMPNTSYHKLLTHTHTHTSSRELQNIFLCDDRNLVIVEFDPFIVPVPDPGQVVARGAGPPLMSQHRGQLIVGTVVASRIWCRGGIVCFFLCLHRLHTVSIVAQVSPSGKSNGSYSTGPTSSACCCFARGP